jgi:transitional endoplasmic reticulum ATPase
MERMRCQLLAEMDGFDELKNVLVLAATNNPNIIHPALLRPGRFDKLLYIPPPDKVARLNILKIHTKRKTITEDVDLDHLADISAGSVGADLQALVKEAAMFSLREYLIKHEENSEFENNIAELSVFQMRHFEQAKEKINLSKEVKNLVDV